MELTRYNLDAVNALLRLRRERRISWRAVGLGTVIASFAHQETGEAWPSRSTLEAVSGIESRDIPRVTCELRDAGFMVIEEREGRSNIYRLTYGETAACGKSPMGKQPPTCGDLAAKPMGKQPPIIIKEQSINNETTTSHISETSIPKDKPDDDSFPQGTTPPPLPPAPAAEPGKRNARTKPNQHPAWLLWLRVNRDAGQPTPLEEKASLAAARKLAEQISDPEEQEAVMLAYIGDKADAWAIRQGLTLSVLVNSRLSKCRAAAARVVKEQAADDAELIRQAVETFPDPDERADFFYQRSVRGLRVPPGVDCRPMPAEKEAAV